VERETEKEREREDTTQKSIGKAQFPSAEGCTPGSLGSKHTRWEVHAMLPLSCPWIGQVLGFTIYKAG
jgi:hypothetical protein